MHSPSPKLSAKAMTPFPTLILAALLFQASPSVATPTTYGSRMITRHTYIRHKLQPSTSSNSRRRIRRFPSRFHLHHTLASASHLDLYSIQRQVHGFIGDSCDEFSTCVPPRLCIDPNVRPRDVCSKSSTECFCNYKNEEEKLCTCDKPCPTGERCVKSPSGESSCLSSSLSGIEIECENPVKQGQGRFNYEPCVQTDECAESRSCVRLVEGGYAVPCYGKKDCICLADDGGDETCSCRYPECPEGEKCSSLDAQVACTSNALNDPEVSCASSTPPPSTGSKFTGEPCTANEECAGLRLCAVVVDYGLKPCDGKQDCTCETEEYEDHICSCKYPECLPGDTCSFDPVEVACISRALLPHPLLCNNSMATIPSETFDDAIESSDPTGKGRKKYSFEICQSDDECAGNRGCYDYDFNECKNSKRCTCRPRNERFDVCSCEKPSCMKGDICGYEPRNLVCHSSNLDRVLNRCPSSTEPSPAITQPNAIITPDLPQDSPQLSPPPPQQLPSLSTNVCIDASALTHFHTHHLVFQHHPLSRVLCDQSGSCATPGHIIQYNGRPMMMKTYCEGVGCVEKVMEVNSPRYRRGVRVGSRTAGLEYTAFAARHETRGEEAFLSLFIYVGL